MIKMKILHSLRSGFSRTLKVRRGILITWFCFFILVLVFAFPLRRSLSTAFGSSMIVDELSDGFNFEIFSDLGPAFKTLISFFTGGFVFVFITGFLLNAFMTSGLFGTLKSGTKKFSSPLFFSYGARNFWSFFLISFILTLLIDITFIIIVVLPAGFVSMAETVSERSIFTAIIIGGSIFLLLLPYLLVVTDFARSWRSANEDHSAFKAMGSGFRLASSTFRSSYPMMLILVAAQILIGLIVILMLPAWKPGTAGGVFLLLIISQLMLYIRLMLKTWRFASITSMMEDVKAQSDAGKTNKMVESETDNKTENLNPEPPGHIEYEQERNN